MLHLTAPKLIGSDIKLDVRQSIRFTHQFTSTYKPNRLGYQSGFFKKTVKAQNPRIRKVVIDTLSLAIRLSELLDSF